MDHVFRGLGVAVFSGMSVLAAHAVPVIGGDAAVDPTDFRITTFATGLNYPYGMVELADGSILVGTSNPGTGSGFSNADSFGELIRLADTNGDGVADTSTTLFTGLPTRMTDVRRAGDLLLVSTASPTSGAEARINVLRLGATPSDALTAVGSIDIDYASTSVEHSSYALAVRPVAGQPNQHQVFFNLGSAANAVPTPTTEAVTLSGLATGTASADSIYAVTLTDTGDAVTADGLVQIATGLRNAAGMAFDPDTGDLYLQDNGIDGNPRSNALGADELNRIAAADLGVNVPDFGFSDDYIDYNTGQRVGNDPAVTQPVAAFTPWQVGEGDEAVKYKNEGAVQIAFAPESFPDGLSGGVFIGFHGHAPAAGAANTENPLLYVDPETGEYFHFISTTEPGIGHLDGLLATEEALFVADLGPLGNLFNGSNDGKGVIYKITAIPEPGVAVTALLLATLLPPHRRQSTT